MRFRLLLPLIAMGLQLSLLVASLVVHREPWVLSSAVTPAGADSDAEGTVRFSPQPELRVGRILKADLVLGLPAVYLGALLHLGMSLLHFPGHGEPALIASSALFVPLVWYGIGRWIDRQLGREYGSKREGIARIVSRFLLRMGGWFFLAVFAISLTPAYHHKTAETNFLCAVAILWTGVYAGCTAWGDWRLQRKAEGATR